MMYRKNPLHETGRVSLIQANDSVRSMNTASPSLSTASTSTTLTSGFAPSTTMSKQQPVRVLARPPPVTSSRTATATPTYGHIQQYHHAAQHHGVGGGVQPPFGHALAGRSYNELVDMADQRRRQIEANRREEERRHILMARSHGIPPAEWTMKVRTLRREVAEEEMELKRLTELERETRTLRKKNEEATRTMETMTRTVEEEQMQLRKAAAKVDSLRAQLEELHRRRRAAANAALIEQKRMHTAQAHSAQMQAIAMRAAASSTPTATHEHAQRPRASVEPFQIQQSKSPEGAMKTASKDYDEPDFNAPYPPSQDPAAINGGASTCKIRVADHQQSGVSTTQTTTITVSSTSGQDQQQKREDVSPSPPKDPHPTVIPPSVVVTTFSANQDSSFSQGDDAHPRLRGGKTDLVSLRADSLKATKRRSWAASESTTFGEADAIRRILLEEQRKGRNHFFPELSSDCMGTVTEEKMEQEEPPFLPPSSNKKREEEEIINEETSSESTLPEPSDAFLMPRPTTIGGVQKSPSPQDGSTSSAEESVSICSTDTVEMEIPPPQTKPVKGILKAKDAPKKGRSIEFDPLALLLDAALEGEVDLVMESAQKLSDVSASNDEGITALHNAICAGHYEIVRFLIEKNADVNAQDSDGWTPLHCAASCNNLPMVRVLVEGGACVLASTLSDLETPVEKCEEEEDGYDGCRRYLEAAHNATGTANGGVVYAAYGYTAERDDELSFDGGERLRVMEKDGETEIGWWRCEKTSDALTQEGLVPRTYLALYPPLKYREKLNFVPFDFASEANNNDKNKQ